jgi:putative transposase
LKNLTIDRPNQAWASDITYIPMKRGFVYLVAIIDWATRRVLAHRVSISMTADFCVEALQEAIAKYGTPEIFNTDQGSQFTSDDFTAVLQAHGIRISMDGQGRWIDNVFVERLWKSVKYEHVYLHAYESVAEAKQQLTGYFTFYNTRRPHSSLGGITPDTAYFGKLESKSAA